VLALAVPAIANCGRTTKQLAHLTSADTTSDDELAVRVDERLGEQPHVSMAARDVSVSVENGVATLRGKVRSARDRETIHAVADGTPGVIGLRDEIVVVPEGPTRAESDHVITQAAMRALRAEPSLRGLVDQLHVQCDAGIVTIRREGLTDAQDRAVTNLLETLPGVIVVTDEGAPRR
jgi:hypothetical protein